MQNLKKLILSLGVVLTFMAYSFQQRHESLKAVEPPGTTGNSTNQITIRSGENEEGDDGNVITPKANPASTAPKPASGSYRDGSYTGSSADAYYGYIQVKAIITGGKITDVQFLDHPQDNPTSRYINGQAMPYLKQEAITAQNANVNVITGATDTSLAFQQSLSSALSQAKL